MIQIKSPNAGLLFMLAGLACSRFKTDPNTTENNNLKTNLTTFNHYPAIRNLDQKNLSDDGLNHFSDTRLTFDPLSALEIRLIDIIIRQYRNTTVQGQLKFIGLEDAAKPRLNSNFHLPHNASADVVHRRAKILLKDSIDGTVWAVVNLSTLRVENWVAGKLVEDDDEIFENSVVFQNVTPRHIYNVLFLVVLLSTYIFFKFNFDEFGDMPSTGMCAIVCYYTWLQYTILSYAVHYAFLALNRYLYSNTAN